jgi:tetratricopeptide (TPR) repeat protein
MKCIKLLSIAVALFGITMVSSAQTVQDVADARNKGSELMAAGNLEGAITEFEKCVELAKQVGEDAEEYSMLVESALPGLYLQNAKNILNAKDYNAALQALEATIAAAEKYNNAGVKTEAEKSIPQIYYALGATEYSAKNWDAAIPLLEKAIALDPNSARSYFLMGFCYQELKNEDKMAENYKLAIEKGNAIGDQTSANNAKTKLFAYYYTPGAQAKNAQKWDEAIALLSKAAEVDDTNPTIFQALSSCYNSKKNWDNAISNGEKALELNPKATDGIYYELGLAYTGKNNTAKACECFKKVENEPYLKGAKHYIEVTLKCK